MIVTQKKTPHVNIGDTVLWFQGGIRDARRVPMPAFVTRINVGSLGLNVINCNNQMMQCAEGVKHIDDKTAQESERIMDGAWDITDSAREMQEWMQMMHQFISTPKKA